MRCSLACLLALMLSLIASRSQAHDPNNFDWDAWRSLAVQHGGRHKPLDSLSLETLRLIANRSSYPHPLSGEKLDAVMSYLMMLFDWSGWHHPDHGRLLLQMDWRPLYFVLHTPDHWDRAPLLRVDFLELRPLLGMTGDQGTISPLDLSQAVVQDPRSEKEMSFTAWAGQLQRLEDENHKLSNLETKGLELAHRLWTYQDHRMGRELGILPLQTSGPRTWMPVAHLRLTAFDDANDPGGSYRKAQSLLAKVWKSYDSDDRLSFNQHSHELMALLAEVGPELGDYPDAHRLQLELAYNRWGPFRFAWIFVLSSSLAMLLYLGSGWKLLGWTSWLAYALGLAAMLVGFSLRIAIAGRPPVTNMYESVVYVAFGVAVLGLLLELIYRRRFILTAASAVAAVALVIADSSPAILDAGFRPLEPVLRSNFWLVTHVMTITLSYAAFALALGIANITLGYFLVQSTSWDTISALSRFTYKALQIGVLLLAAGTILGGVWADYSWGRFWGWDPKEVWALIALLGYLCVLHARFIGWVGQRGLAVLSVLCFSLVVMAWYGVNFVLGAGLHSYGFGDGGQGYVYTAVLIQASYVGLAAWRSRPRSGSADLPERPHSQPTWQVQAHRVHTTV